MLARRSACRAPPRPSFSALRPAVNTARSLRLTVPLVHQRGTRHFAVPPEEWSFDKKNYSLTHYIAPPAPPKRAPPHPWRLVPAKPGLDVEKFMKKIGKGCDEHADKFESWEELMSARTWELKQLDIPTRQRKWILKHTWKYREGRLDAWRWDFPEVSEW